MKNFLPESGLIFVAVIWGITFVVVKDAVALVDPFIFNSFRFFLAALILIGSCACAYPEVFTKLSRKIIAQGTILGLWLFLGFTCLTQGLVYTNATNAGFITGLNVVLVPLLGIFFLKQKLAPPCILGIISAMAGLYCLTGIGTSSWNKGDLMIFLGAFAFSFHVIFTGKYSQKNSTLLLVVIQFLAVGLLSGCCAFLTENNSLTKSSEVIISYEFLRALIVVAVFSTGLAILIQTKAQRKTTPTKVVLIFSLEPVFAAVTEYYCNGEMPGSTAVIGCVFIFFGIILAGLPDRNSKFFHIFDFNKPRRCYRPIE